MDEHYKRAMESFLRWSTDSVCGPKSTQWPIEPMLEAAFIERMQQAFYAGWVLRQQKIIDGITQKFADIVHEQ